MGNVCRCEVKSSGESPKVQRKAAWHIEAKTNRSSSPKREKKKQRDLTGDRIAAAAAVTSIYCCFFSFLFLFGLFFFVNRDKRLRLRPRPAAM